MNAATMAGIASTLVFLASNLPMVVRAARTRDLSSYSRGNLVMVNAGNAAYTLYVISLPVGPIWVLHLVYSAASAFMLAAHLCWADTRPAGAPSGRSQAQSAVAASEAKRFNPSRSARYLVTS